MRKLPKLFSLWEIVVNRQKLWLLKHEKISQKKLKMTFFRVNEFLILNIKVFVCMLDGLKLEYWFLKNNWQAQYVFKFFCAQTSKVVSPLEPKKKAYKKCPFSKDRKLRCVSAFHLDNYQLIAHRIIKTRSQFVLKTFCARATYSIMSRLALLCPLTIHQ